METKTYTINNVKCAGCANRATQLLSAIPGVEEVKVDVAKKTAVIQYNEDQVKENQFQQALADTNFNIQL